MRVLQLIAMMLPRAMRTAQSTDHVTCVMPPKVVADDSGRITVHQSEHQFGDGNPAWPDDPDEVPQWRLSAEAAAWEYGYRLPGYRTQREFWTAVDLAEMTAASQIAAPTKAALPACDSARDFLAALQSRDTIGEYTSPELGKLYEQHCADSNVEPSDFAVVKAELALLAGVYRDFGAGRRGVKPSVAIINWTQSFAVHHGRKPKPSEVHAAFPSISLRTAWRYSTDGHFVTWIIAPPDETCDRNLVDDIRHDLQYDVQSDIFGIVENVETDEDFRIAA